MLTIYFNKNEISDVKNHLKGLYYYIDLILILRI